MNKLIRGKIRIRSEKYQIRIRAEKNRIRIRQVKNNRIRSDPDFTTAYIQCFVSEILKSGSDPLQKNPDPDPRLKEIRGFGSKGLDIDCSSGTIKDKLSI